MEKTVGHTKAIQGADAGPGGREKDAAVHHRPSKDQLSAHSVGTLQMNKNTPQSAFYTNGSHKPSRAP